MLSQSPGQVIHYCRALYYHQLIVITWLNVAIVHFTTEAFYCYVSILQFDGRLGRSQILMK